MYYSNYGGMLYLSPGMHLAKLCKFEVLQVCQGEIYNFLSSQYSKRFCEGFYIIPFGSF